MNIAILTFEGFNELDSFIVFNILSKVKNWNVRITSPTEEVTSKNGLTIKAQEKLGYANSANVVIIGSGVFTRTIVEDKTILNQLNLDPAKQLIGSQCSGALIMEKLGLLSNLTVCTDLITKPWVQEAGINVLEQAFVAKNNIATAGGCMASEYLATWVMLKKANKETVESILGYVAPVGEETKHVSHCLSVVNPYC